MAKFSTSSAEKGRRKLQTFLAFSQATPQKCNTCKIGPTLVVNLRASPQVLTTSFHHNTVPYAQSGCACTLQVTAGLPAACGATLAGSRLTRSLPH